MLGWLHCTPEKAEKPRIITEPEWPLPDVGAFYYIANWFIELRLDYGYLELKAWSDLTGVEPTPKEVELLIMMTGTYQNSVIKYRSERYNSRPPFDNLEDKSSITQRNLAVLFGD